MQTTSKIDLDIALKTIHELAVAEGDLGREYWNQISTLLKRAADMQSLISSLSLELELCRAQQQNNGVAAGSSLTALKGLIRKPLNPVTIDEMSAPSLRFDDELLEKAQALTGLKDKTTLVRQALLALIERNTAAD